MARYSPGQWFAIVTPAGAALLPPTVPEATVEQVWTALRGGDGLGAVIEGLVGAFGTSLSLLPDFAVLTGSGDELRLAVRGGATASVLTAGSAGPEVIAGAGVTTWSERALTQVTSAVLAAPGAAAGPTLPIADGIVLAGSVEVLARGTVPAAPGQGTVPAVPLPPADPGQQEPSPVPLGAPEPGQQEPSPVPPAPADRPVPAETTWVEPADDAAHDFAELLFGETVISSVEAAAVRQPEAEPPADEPVPIPAPAPLPVPPAVVAAEPAPAPAPAPPVAAPSMIQGVPGRPQPAGDHDGETVLSDEVRQVAVGISQPTTPLQRTPPVLLAPGHPPLALDRGAIVGTRPQLSRVQGSNVPHLVAVTSPSGEISRNHLELRVEARTVLAVDLNSTNGTVLLRAGSDPVRLHPGEPSMLVAGDRIDLGDGVMLSFEGLE